MNHHEKFQAGYVMKQNQLMLYNDVVYIAGKQ